MIDYPALEAVFTVIDEGSFDRAAARLGVTPSAVSHRVKALEERIGTALVLRGTPCRATEAGRRLCRHVERVRLLEADLGHAYPALSRGGRAGAPPRVRLVVNADSLATWCIEALAEVTERTGILYDIVVEDQDHAVDWLARGAADAAVTASASPAVGCDVHPLGALRYRATASPAFVTRHFAGGVTRRALSQAPCLTFDRKDGLQRRWIERHFGTPLHPPTHRLPSSTAFVEAARLAIGWGLNPEPLVAAHLATGDLVELLPETPVDTPLYWQVSRLTSDLLAELTAGMRKAARRALHRPPSQPPASSERSRCRT